MKPVEALARRNPQLNGNHTKRLFDVGPIKPASALAALFRLAKASSSRAAAHAHASYASSPLLLPFPAPKSLLSPSLATPPPVPPSALYLSTIFAQPGPLVSSSDITPSTPWIGSAVFSHKKRERELRCDVGSPRLRWKYFCFYPPWGIAGYWSPHLGAFPPRDIRKHSSINQSLNQDGPLHWPCQQGIWYLDGYLLAIYWLMACHVHSVTTNSEPM